ncbi:MAG: CxxxxCH/CxxCH domain-containing protein [Deltaproteobacteria bacterium]|nr:CxxxxCH/CxxCH domain-containing protein [Deltaproteobacteria bacterium]
MKTRKRTTDPVALAVAALLALGFPACLAVRNDGDGVGSGQCGTCHLAIGDGPTHEAFANADTYGKPVPCATCHVVPPTAAATETHRNGKADVIFAKGSLARADGASPSWDGKRCKGTYCHGATLSGGADTSPAWGAYEKNGLPCIACHGHPPSENHPDSTQCVACHDKTFADDGLNLDYHLDGKVEVSGAACGTCHDANGGGASHDAHRTAGTYGKPVPCDTCHEVPLTPAQSGKHRNGTVDVIFAKGSLATTGGVFPSWDGTRCNDVYCHGATLNGGEDTSPTWNGSLAGLPCKACHGYPPGGGHEQSTGCAECHSSTISGGGVNLKYHMDGKIEASGDKLAGDAP